jgi:REP element-mobilizing transposase RayT
MNAMHITKNGAYYRKKLPHYRSPGCIYHCRFSLNPLDACFRLNEDWMLEIVEASILTEHKKECIIHAYVIMANHAHAVIQPIPKAKDLFAWCDYLEFYPLEEICGRIKGRSSFLINKHLGHCGRIWQRESFDRTIRNEADLEATIDYIHHNPVRWEIAASPEQYRWSSLQTIYSGKGEYRGWFDF